MGESTFDCCCLLQLFLLRSLLRSARCCLAVLRQLSSHRRKQAGSAKRRQVARSPKKAPPAPVTTKTESARHSAKARVPRRRLPNWIHSPFTIEDMKIFQWKQKNSSREPIIRIPRCPCDFPDRLWSSAPAVITSKLRKLVWFIVTSWRSFPSRSSFFCRNISRESKNLAR